MASLGHHGCRGEGRWRAVPAARSRRTGSRSAWARSDWPASALRRRNGVDDGLGFLELGDGERAAQAADAALLVAALGEAVVDRRPGVGPDGAGLDLAANPAAGVDAGGEDA